MSGMFRLKLATWRYAFLGTLVAMLTLGASLPAFATPQLGDNQWTKRDLDGVRVNALAVEQNPNALYAGSNGGGIFHTTSAGQSWRAANNGLGNLFVNAISIDPDNQTHALAGTGRGPAAGEASAGIYRTTSRGESWTPVLTSVSIHGLARTPQDPRVVYAVGAGVYKSTDGGATWTRLGAGDPDLANIELRGIAVVSTRDPNRLIAVGNTEGGTGRIVGSSDGGSSWSLILGGIAPVFDVGFSAATRSGSLILVATQTGVLRSTNGGMTFHRVTEELGDVSVLDVEFNPLAPAQTFIGTQGRGVFQSGDGGANWSAVNPGLGNQTVRSLGISRATPQTLYAGTDDGVFAYTFIPQSSPPPPSAVSWFFAEGSTQQPFDTWFLIQNPTNHTAKVRFTFQLEGGGVIVRDVVVGRTSRFSFFANQVIPNQAFSTRIDSDQAVFAERSMFVGYDGHVVTGIPGPHQTWLFAEGSTQNPFHTWLLLQNPQSEPATATITYLLQDGAPITQTLSLPPTSRTSIFVNQVLPNQAFSARVESNLPIVAERAMYRFPGNAATGVSGVNAPSTTWYFAEANTSGTFDTFLLLQNPNAGPVTATLTLFARTGIASTHPLTLPPTSRQTIHLNLIRPNDGFAMTVEASAPIVAEKSLFFGAEPKGAAATQGAEALATTWNLPEGSTAPPFDEIISIANPNEETMNVHIDFQLPNGEVIGRDFLIPSKRRGVIVVDDIIPNTAVSAKVTTSLPSVVERTMFFDKLGSIGGHNTIGIR